MGDASAQEFSAYFAAVEPRLRHALIAGFGPDDGREAAADALAWGWQHWDRLRAMDNPDGYLYRVGRNRALRQRTRDRRQTKGRPVDEPATPWHFPDFEPALGGFLALLSHQQRTCVWLVHGLGYTLADTARMLGCSRSTVAAHVHRALAILRAGLEAPSDS